VLAQIRSACAEVAERARWVRIDEEALARFAAGLELSAVAAPRYDAAHHYVGDPEVMLAFNLTLDAVNFGSGYFPHLLKRPGKSGYFTVALALKEHVERHGPLSPRELVALTPPRTAALFGQDLQDPVRAELMRLFTEALHQLGSYLLERFGGSFAALVAAAEGRAERLAELLAEMPYFRDVSRYGELTVPLFKRAQIAPSDLALAFDGAGYGRFTDLDKLTIFADNLVPHVLRVDGVLRYDPALLARLEAGALIPAGSAEEVEIRAVALHAVERLVALLRAANAEVSARQLDVYLWNRGQGGRYKAAPRHRTRSVFY
jgi:hypothetical protein